MLTTTGNLMLLDMTIVLGIGVPYLVHIVSATLTGSFAEIEGSQVHVGITEQGVAHHKHIVELVVATGNQTATIGRLTLIARLNGRHRCCAHLDPHELPVKIQVIA